MSRSVERNANCESIDLTVCGLLRLSIVAVPAYFIVYLPEHLALQLLLQAHISSQDEVSTSTQELSEKQVPDQSTQRPAPPYGVGTI